MSSTKFSAWILWIVLLAGFAGVVKLQQHIDNQRAALHVEQDDLVLRSGAMLKIASLEYAPLIADLYWTRVVQYYGDKHARHDSNIDLLWPLLDITTTLDPELIVAYRFGSMFLSQPAPQGAGRPDLAVELIQRGIQANPDQWRLYEDLGFIYYFDLKDYAKASAAFLEGSKNPDAQVWMKVLAAKVLEQGESPDTSAFLWSEIYTSTSDPIIKKNALTHLQLLKAQGDCTKLDVVAAEYARNTGHFPSTVRDLVYAGLLRSEPADPLGFVYIFNTDDKAQINPESPLFKEQPRIQRPL